MIPIEEIRSFLRDYEVPLSYLRKDNVMSWLLNGIYNDPVLSENLVLKGGNCLRKICFPETRFSVDLDFTKSRFIDSNILEQK